MILANAEISKVSLMGSLKLTRMRRRGYDVSRIAELRDKVQK
jgi:hypothetical protein